MLWLNRNRVVVAAGLLFGLFTFAQNDTLINGVDTSGNVLRILVDTSGRLVTEGAHGACTNTTMNVGTTGTACPPTPRASRSSILIQLVQAGETLTVMSNGDPGNLATATNGVQVSSGGSYDDDLAGTVSTNCRCSAATCSVRIVECP